MAIIEKIQNSRKVVLNIGQIADCQLNVEDRIIKKFLENSKGSDDVSYFRGVSKPELKHQESEPKQQLKINRRLHPEKQRDPF